MSLIYRRNICQKYKQVIILFFVVVPGSAPKNLKVRNKTSTSIYVEWEPIPVEYQQGKVLGYKVKITAEEQKGQISRRKKTNNMYTESRSLAFARLKNYNKYVISVSGLTRRGEGPARSLTVQVDGKTSSTPVICESSVVQFHFSCAPNPEEASEIQVIFSV